MYYLLIIEGIPEIETETAAEAQEYMTDKYPHATYPDYAAVIAYPPASVSHELFISHVYTNGQWREAD